MKLILFLLAFLFLTAPALADVFDAPCSRYRVPKRLVLAIAKTESGLDPWCVNHCRKDIPTRLPRRCSGHHPPSSRSWPLA